MEEPKHKDIGPIRVTSPGATVSVRVTKAKHQRRQRSRLGSNSWI